MYVALSDHSKPTNLNTSCAHFVHLSLSVAILLISEAVGPTSQSDPPTIAFLRLFGDRTLPVSVADVAINRSSSSS